MVNIAKYDAALPFANLARMAFVAISFLNSMVEKKIILNSEKENFINSIDLVTTKMLLSKNKMSKEKLTFGYEPRKCLHSDSTLLFFLSKNLCYKNLLVFTFLWNKY